MLRIASVLVFCAWIIFPVAFASASDLTRHMKCFSDMSYEETENDYVGFVVLLMQHRTGVTVVFQEGAGALERPVLAEAKVEKGNIMFELPPSALTPGLWKGKLLGKNLIVSNPAGQSFTLKPICR